MSPETLKALRARRSEIRERWDTLMRLERVNSPLANPDMLVHLIPESLKRVFAALENTTDDEVTLARARAERLPPCSCGNNPYLAYFVAGEQAITETIVLQQAASHQARENDLALAVHAIRSLGCSEIDTFCSVCTCRGKSGKCRHAAAGR